MNNQKGFTIIELIVVIAIIAILASVVLVNVTQYIAKSNDATIQADIDAMRTSAATFEADSARGNGSYTGFDTDTNTNLAAEYTTPVVAINKASGASTGFVGSFNATTFCMSSPLRTDAAVFWCVDSAGTAGAGTKVCDISTHLCVVAP